MSPEIINTGTAVATAVGYTAGIVVERIAVARIAHNEQEEARTDTYARAHEENIESPDSVSTLQKVVRTGLAPLVLVAAGTVGVNYTAWLAPASQSVEEAQPTLEILADHSGATNRSVDGKTVVSEINGVVEEFAGAPLTTSTTIARAGTFKTVEIAQVKDDVPFGEADMQKGTEQALSRVSKVVPVNEGKTLKRNAGVLVVTNGNQIGNEITVAQEAISQYGMTAKTPIFVVNVEADANSATTEQLQSIAQATGGQYWDAKSSNFEDVAKNVRKTITAHEEVTKAKENRAPWKGLGILLGAALAMSIIRRTDWSLGRGPKGE